MKRILSIILSVLMLVSVMPVSVLATSHALAMKVDTSSFADGVNPGETLKIPVAVTENDGVSVFGFEAVYDENVFEPVTSTYTGGEVVTGITAANNMAFYENANLENITGLGVLFYINLKVKETAPAGETEIGVKIVNDNAEQYCYYIDADYNMVPISPSFTVGTITIAAKEEEVKTGYINGSEVLTFDQVKADNYTLTAPGEGSYYFAGWFQGLDAAGITANDAGYYVLSAGTASGTAYTLTESRPKYDASYDATAAYNALWVYDDESAIRAFILGVVGNTVTFYSTTGDDTTLNSNTSTLLKDTLTTVGTTGYVKMLHDITGASFGTAQMNIRLDTNGNSLAIGYMRLKGTGNALESSFGKGQIIGTTSGKELINLYASNTEAVIRDLKIESQTGDECINFRRGATITLLQNCELVVAGNNALCNEREDGLVKLIDNCTMTTDYNTIINSGTIESIVNSKITSSATDKSVIKNSGSIVFGGNNEVTGYAQLVNGGNVTFTGTTGTYKVTSPGIAPVLDGDCVLTTPDGYVVQEVEGALAFVPGYKVTYKSYDGSETLYVENIVEGSSPSGNFTVTYPNEQTTVFTHMGWAESVNGAVITDYSVYNSATTFYAVRAGVEQDAKVLVIANDATYQYLSLDEAINAFNAGEIPDTAGTAVTFKLLSNATVSTTITSKNASLTLDLNGFTLNTDYYNAEALIKDAGAVNGRTITLTSGNGRGKIHADNNAGNLVGQGYGLYNANVQVQNLDITCDAGSTTSIIVPMCDPGCQINYRFVNVNAELIYSAVQINTILSTGTFVVEVMQSNLVSKESTVVSGTLTEEVMLVKLDADSKLYAPVAVDGYPIIGLVNVPTGYTFADSDGDGWYMAERNKVEIEGNTGTTEAPEVTITEGTNSAEINNAEVLGDLESLTVNHAVATLKFLADALDSIGSFGHANVSISVAEAAMKEGEAKRMSFNVKNGSEDVPFTGSVEVTTSFTGVEGKKYAIFHDDNGTLKLVSTDVTADSTDPTKFNAAFTVKHFSDYVAAEYTDPYTAELNVSADTVVNGENIVVNVNVSGTETTFSSAKIVVNYDPVSMEYVEGSGKCNATGLTEADVAATFTNDATAGTVTILDYGEAMATGEGIYSLTFKTKDGGNTNVSMTGGLSTQAQAESKDLSAVAATEEVVTINHKVTVNEQDGGSVSPNGDGTYELTIDGYDGDKYTYEVSATVDGTTVDPSKIKDNGDGTYTIEGVTGDLVITHTATVKSFAITWDDTENAVTTEKATTGTYDKDVVFTVKAGEAAGDITNGYKYTVKVTQTGTEAEIEATPVVNADDTTTYTIAAANIPGNITISVKKETVLSTQVEIKVSGEDVTVWVGETQITNGIVDRGAEVTLKLAVDSDYTYSVTLDDGTEVIMNNTTTQYIIEDIQASVIVKVSKVFNTAHASVVQYMTLDGTNMWLVKMTTAKVDDKVYTYDSKDMFYSEKYGAYCYLVIANLAGDVDISAAKFGAKTADVQLVDYTMDVNMSTIKDINDAQLVWNMYTCMYNDFDTVGVEKFLRADVNDTVGVDTTDAQAIVSAIQ